MTTTPLISFCTTCHNRSYQLRQTFAENLQAIERDWDTEWVILNYVSEDDLHSFMLAALADASSRVSYVCLRRAQPWHLCVAKNLAHRHARGRMLVNLDCDNFIADAANVVRQSYAAGGKLLHLWSGTHRDGTCGRIATVRDLFYALGGYDENLLPMGYQDGDLLARASAFGVRGMRMNCPPTAAIANTKEDSVRHCPGGPPWQEMDRLNRAASLANIKAGRLTAASSGRWTPLDCAVERGRRSTSASAAARVRRNPAASDPRA